VRIELEGNNQSAGNSTNMIDENWLSLESGLGSIQLGTTDDVRQKMMITPSNAGFGSVRSRTGANRTGASTDGTIDTTSPDLFQGDGEKINYFTPRLFGMTRTTGLQLGVSYTPSSNVSRIGADNTSAEARSGKYNRGMTFGFNYTEIFGDIIATLGGGYHHWKTDQRDIPEPDVYSVGLNLGYGGFTLGASYGRVEDGRDDGGCTVTTSAGAVGAGCTSNTAETIDGDAWSVGLLYNFGPARASITYISGENDTDRTLAGEDEGELWNIGFEYTLGPGVRWAISGSHVEFDDEAPGVAGAAGTGYGGWGYGLTTGIRITF
jgi:predicted porin